MGPRRAPAAAAARRLLSPATLDPTRDGAILACRVIMSQTDATRRTFTAVVPTERGLPDDLALLLAPVVADEPSAPEEYVGRADGVLLDERGRVEAFIVRLATKLDPRCRRALVPVSALTLLGGPTLSLAWTEDQLRVQPHLDGDLQHDDRDSPAESQRIAAHPAVVPPGAGNGSEVLKDGLEGGLLGATLGAIAGMAIGGPIGAASLAVFFATGGAVGGVIAGAAVETAVDASEARFTPLGQEDPSALGVALRRLQERLRDPGLQTAGFLTATWFTPTVSEASPSLWQEAAGWG
jgi:hypothetical protein